MPCRMVPAGHGYIYAVLYTFSHAAQSAILCSPSRYFYAASRTVLRRPLQHYISPVLYFFVWFVALFLRGSYRVSHAVLSLFLAVSH